MFIHIFLKIHLIIKKQNKKIYFKKLKYFEIFEIFSKIYKHLHIKNWIINCRKKNIFQKNDLKMFIFSQFFTKRFLFQKFFSKVFGQKFEFKGSFKSFFRTFFRAFFKSFFRTFFRTFFQNFIVYFFSGRFFKTFFQNFFFQNLFLFEMSELKKKYKIYLSKIRV